PPFRFTDVVDMATGVVVRQGGRDGRDRRRPGRTHQRCRARGDGGAEGEKPADRRRRVRRGLRQARLVDAHGQDAALAAGRQGRRRPRARRPPVPLHPAARPRRLRRRRIAQAGRPPVRRPRGGAGRPSRRGRGAVRRGPRRDRATPQGDAEMTGWLLDTLLYTGVLIALVLVLRRPVSRHFGPQIAYALWGLPFLR